MRRRKRMKHHLQALHNQRLRANELLCEECGTVYDQRTGEGSCAHCSREEPEPEVPPPID